MRKTATLCKTELTFDLNQMIKNTIPSGILLSDRADVNTAFIINPDGPSAPPPSSSVLFHFCERSEGGNNNRIVHVPIYLSGELGEWVFFFSVLINPPPCCVPGGAALGRAAFGWHSSLGRHCRSGLTAAPSCLPLLIIEGFRPLAGSSAKRPWALPGPKDCD